MTEASEWQRSTDSGGSPSSARSTTATGGGHGTAPGGPRPDGSESGTVTGPSEAILGPFTLRELTFGGGVLLVFIGTLLPYIDGAVRYVNFWNSTSLFFTGIGILLPVAALTLLAGRRLGAAGLRVGSLSVDQFASVASVLAGVYFFLETVMAFHVGPFLCLLGAIVMLVSTVLAPFLPVLKNDFVDRPEVPAHVAARPMTAARPRPRVEKPAKEAGGSLTDSSYTVSSPTASSSTTSSAVSSPVHSSADQRDETPVNPAAAGVRQNGTGLYRAGGAGVIGAGAAASGQSGLGAGSAPAKDDSEERKQDVGPTGDRDGRVTGGSSAAQGSSRLPDPLEDEDATAAEPVSSRIDETRVNEVVRDEYARPGADSDRPDDRSRQEPITATRAAAEEPVVEAFWFAVGSSRPVYDEQTGREVFSLEPGDWEVGIEDRGDEFLVQDKRTGAMGVLRDLGNIERAPRD